ncbi:MAG: HEPN domain-containing protein [Bacilli bacterium]|nr:HEPN domain-containing protein [Bacilli bacterium]
MNDNYYSIAVTNLNSAIILFRYAIQDETQLNVAGYHLEQALEFALKFELEMNGISYPKTHDIEFLIKLAKDGGIQLNISDYIEDHAEMFSSWESKSRYILGYSIEYKKIETSIKEIDEYLKKLSTLY